MKNPKKEHGHDIPENLKIYYRNFYLSRIKELEDIYYKIFETSQTKNNEEIEK